LTYAAYLDLATLLSAQHPRSSPPHHDELLFIIQHQTSELWFTLVLHELRAVRRHLAADDLGPALKGIARVKHIQDTLAQQWTVLGTLTPSEYSQFRKFLATSSGFQSAQYRMVEFILGNKQPRMLAAFDDDPPSRSALEAELTAPSIYDEFIALMSRHGLGVPVDLLDRDWSAPRELSDGLVRTFLTIYSTPEQHWELYETCEELVDLEDSFQTWRFRHLKTVERIIGNAPGTGGSAGVAFLRRALDQSFFPELYAVRGHLAEGTRSLDS